MRCTVEAVVPGGFESAGAWRRALFIRPWCGRDEMFLIDALESLPPAACATALLGRCVSLDGAKPAGAAFAARLSAGDREALLVQLRRLTLGDRLACVIVCQDCGEQMDLDIKVSDLLVGPYRYETEEHRAQFEAGGHSYAARFRLPNGSDIEFAAAIVSHSEDNAVTAVLSRCVRSILDEDGGSADPLPGAVRDRISAAMAELDPQAEIALECRCTGCGAGMRVIFDAAQYVLREIAAGAQTLFQQVHELASGYHWRETDILGLSARRRARYAELLP